MEARKEAIGDRAVEYRAVFDAAPDGIVLGEPQDPLESIVSAIPLVLPLMAGVLIFLLAFIAVYMA